MARIIDKMASKANGKIGKKFTVYQRLEQTIIRTLPEDFQPTSEGALAQQKRLSGCTTFYKAVQAAGLSEYWRLVEKAAGQTGYSRFMSANMRAFSAQGWIEAPEKIRLTERAGLELPEAITCQQETTAEGEVRWAVSWENKTGYPPRHASDRAVVALMRGGKYFDVKFAETGDARREDGRLEFVKPKKLDDYVHGYLLFKSASGNQVSASCYLGILL